jgi:hypothetical protein
LLVAGMAGSCSLVVEATHRPGSLARVESLCLPFPTGETKRDRRSRVSRVERNDQALFNPKRQRRADQRADISVADPVQLYLDCRISGERALEAAAAIRMEMGW